MFPFFVFLILFGALCVILLRVSVILDCVERIERRQLEAQERKEQL